MKKEKLQLTPQKYKQSWDYDKQLYANKMDSLEEMDKFLELTISQDWTRKKYGIATEQLPVMKLNH